MNNQFLGTFLNEWDLYQKQGGTPTVDKGRSGKRASDFDRPVHAGEIRVFADSNRQMIGLVYKSWGEDAWIIIPVSEFSVPATEQEILIGTRVYQLWNAFTATASFVEKSWLIDILAPDDQQDICAALLHVTIGEPLREDLLGCIGDRITAVDDPRLEYERTFLANIAIPLDAEETSEKVEVSAPNVFPRVQWRAPRRRVLWTKYDLSRPAYALAAATDDLFPKVPVLMYTDAWDAMLDGQLASQFCGYRIGDDKRWVTFKLSDRLPSVFDGKDILSVSVYRRDTREQVGSGKLKRMSDGSSRISVQFTADVADAREIVLVVEECDGNES